MSCEQYYRIPPTYHYWKTFIKESSEIAGNEKPNRKIHDLQFKGDEAKAAYEEIINKASIACTVIQSNATAETKVFKNQNSTSAKLSIAKVAQHDTPDKATRFSINTILKAVEQRDISFLKKHLSSESVNLTDNFGWTPLMSAAYCGYSEIVQLLLSLGANKKARDRCGLTAAQLALKKNYLEIVAILRKNYSGNNKNQTVQETSAVTCSKYEEFHSRCKERVKVSANYENLQNDSFCTNDKQNVSFYCEICKMQFRETTLKKHETSTLHIFNTKPKLPSAVYGISKQNKGYRMLLNTGWDEDQGLGPTGQGMKYPLKTTLKLDRKGIGQMADKESRITHSEVHEKNQNMISKRKPLKKKDREKLLSREAKKERAIRLALS